MGLSASMSTTWMIFEIIGTIAFAFSGAVTGLAKRMDIFGIIVLAVLTGVGGGMIRDVLLGITPPTALKHSASLLLSVGTAIMISLLYQFVMIPRSRKKWILIFYVISDTIGLAAFTVTGALSSLYSYPDYFYVLPVMTGLITAVGGGMMRDLMAQRVPVVLKTDVYAIASIAGGFAVCLSWEYISIPAASWIGFGLVLLLRFLAVKNNWQLYHPHPRLHRHHEE